jgi:hypothetical protein
MTSFNQFTLEKPKKIHGGKLVITTCGENVCDAYDTDSERIIYLE